MLKLENRHGFLIAELKVIIKNQNKYGTVNLIVDTGALVTIIEPSYLSFWGYSVRDAVRFSKLDGVYGHSDGYLIEAPKIDPATKKWTQVLS